MTTTDMYFDAGLIARVAPLISMTEAQASAWAYDNNADLSAIRDYVRQAGVGVRQEQVENEAVEGRILNAELVRLGLIFLTETGLIQRLTV